MGHYIQCPVDLSQCMFICTANNMQGIPLPLQDRLEIIRIAGYTEQEKMAIASRYLIPKQKVDNGVDKVDITWKDNATKTIIQLYTREAGVRTLEREVAAVCRKVARDVVMNTEDTELSFNITPAKVKKYLGIPEFRTNKREDEPEVGMATGLAWTQVGGEILQIESGVMPGRGKLIITGKLGDVMQESVKAAKSYVRSKCLEFGIIPPTFEKKDFHIHVPEGATPKDGPSAGIAMVTSIVSSIAKIPVNKDVAMTGEVTITGQVLQIGGLKEKLLAAHRAGIKHVLIPKDNKKDLIDIPKKVKDDIKITAVEIVDEVLKIALTKEFKKVEWTEMDNVSKIIFVAAKKTNPPTHKKYPA